MCRTILPCRDSTGVAERLREPDELTLLAVVVVAGVKQRGRSSFMKRTIRPIVAVAALVLLLPGRARAQDPPFRMQDLPTGEMYRVEALAGIWSPGADVILSSDAPGIPGTRIDLRSDLGLMNESVPEFQLVWRPGLRHKFRFQYLPIHFDSAATLRRDFSFSGVTFPARLPASISLDWSTYRFGYEYGLLVKRRGSVGVIAEVKHTVVRAELRAPFVDEVSRQAMPIPVVGGIVRVYPAARLSLTGEVTFFGVPDRSDGHYGGHVADVDVSAVWNVTRHLGAQAGFRDIDINHLGEWNTATFSLKGLYIGALIRY